MFEIDDKVEKYKGEYGGPGIVRGLIDEPRRYIVAHKIEGGFGELLHIYSEAQLRKCE